LRGPLQLEGVEGGFATPLPSMHVAFLDFQVKQLKKRISSGFLHLSVGERPAHNITERKHMAVQLRNSDDAPRESIKGRRGRYGRPLHRLRN